MERSLMVLGGTGDLTGRMLLPSLAALVAAGDLAPDFVVRAVDPLMLQAGIIAPLMFFLASARLREKIARLNFFYPYPDIDRAMAQFPAGNVEEAAFFLYVATFHQPEMAPPGKHSLKLEAYTSKHSKGIDWERDKERIGDIKRVYMRTHAKTMESACKTVVGQRLKCAGMRWGEPGSEGVCELRALFLSEPGQWDAFWARHHRVA